MHGLMLSLFVKFSNGLPLCKFYPLPVTCNSLVDVSFTCWLTCWCKFYLLPVDSLVNVSFTCYMLTHLVNVEGRKLLSLRLGGLNAVLRDKQLPHIAYSPTRYHLLQNTMKPSDILLPVQIMTVGVEWREQGPLLYSQCPLGGWWCPGHTRPQCPYQPSAGPPDHQGPRRPGPLP